MNGQKEQPNNSTRPPVVVVMGHIDHGKSTLLDYIRKTNMLERGAKIADIAILVVSAVEGVKPQTVEAWKTILESNIPCIVAINKIDKSEANIEKTKMELAE